MLVLHPGSRPVRELEKVGEGAERGKEPSKFAQDPSSEGLC